MENRRLQPRSIDYGGPKTAQVLSANESFDGIPVCPVTSFHPEDPLERDVDDFSFSWLAPPVSFVEDYPQEWRDGFDTSISNLGGVGSQSTSKHVSDSRSANGYQDG